MATKNKTRYAILGVLTISDCTGYDIKKYCDKIISHLWHENYGHIYPVLEQLLSEGAILQVDTPESLRKKTYRISSSGREDFMRWLMEPTESQPARSEFLLKLSFSNNQAKENTIRMIVEYKDHHMKNLEKYHAMEDYLVNDGQKTMLSPQTFYVHAPLRYGILSCEAVITWCDEMIRLLDN